MASKAIVGEKVGMTQIWDDQNRAIPVTVVRVTPARVVQVKTPDKDGYSALQVTHGTHKHHRAPGSIGACATPARVFKGTKMAGHMGAEKVTTLNLEIVQADAERDLLLVKGAVPGPRGGLVIIRDAVKGGTKK